MKLNLKLRKPLYGVGINDSDYATQPRDRSKRCPVFDRWHSMMRRCYSPNSLERFTIYGGCSTSEDWKAFSVFANWMQQQPWEGNSLDKDILVFGNKVYSAETCVFVPPYINSFFTKPGNSKKNSDLPLGVNIKHHLTVNKFVAQGSIGKQRTHLGCYSAPELAHRCWQYWKISEVDRLCATYEKETCFHEGVMRSLLKVKENLMEDIENKRLTEYIKW